MKTILNLTTKKIISENGRVSNQKICIHLFANINRVHPLSEIKYAISDFKNGKDVNLCLL